MQENLSTILDSPLIQENFAASTFSLFDYLWIKRLLKACLLSSNLN